MSEYSGHIAALAAAFGWAISAVCWTAAGKRVGSLVVNTVRLVLALAFFLLYLHFARGEAIPVGVSGHAWFWISLSGITGFFLCDLFLFRSMLLIGPRVALLIFSLSPLVASVLGFWWLSERLSASDVLGMAIALTGVTWVVLESPRKDADTKPHHFSWLGAGFASVAMVTQGLSSVLSKVGMRDLQDPIVVTHIRIMAGLPCFLILLAFLGKLKNCVAVFKDARLMGIITVGSAAGPVIGVTLLMYALTIIPCGLAMTFISITPVFIIPFSILIFKERVSPRAVLGALVACVGLAIMFR